MGQSPRPQEQMAELTAPEPAAPAEQNLVQTNDNNEQKMEAGVEYVKLLVDAGFSVETAIADVASEYNLEQDDLAEAYNLSKEPTIPPQPNMLADARKRSEKESREDAKPHNTELIHGSRTEEQQKNKAKSLAFIFMDEFGWDQALANRVAEGEVGLPEGTLDDK